MKIQNIVTIIYCRYNFSYRISAIKKINYSFKKKEKKDDQGFEKKY